MPRIDPIQLLRCLSVLLSPNGGIKSNDEVHRLASLMTKFSKKLVSKCIYIQILKCTETELLGLFMGSGGWRLAHMWLTESIVAKNWPLVRELLELLLLCPVDIDRLKTNNCPKLVKELSKDGSQAAIRALAAKLVEQWLKSLKGDIVIPISESEIQQIVGEANNFTNTESALAELIPGSSNILEENEETVNDCQFDSQANDLNDECVASTNEVMHSLSKETVKEEDTSKDVEALPILKISLKDGKQVISKIQESDIKKNQPDISEKDTEHKSTKEKSKSIDKKRSSKKSSSKHSSSSRSHSSKSSSSDKHRSSSKSSSSSSSSKDKSRDRSKESSRHSSTNEKHKDKHSEKSHSSSSHKSKGEKSKTDKTNKHEKVKDEKSHKTNKDYPKSSSDKDQSEKNTNSNEKLQPLSVHKMMKIPKLSESHKRETPSISIESRKPNDPNRPKTVKTFNSKFRSHGLEEEAKPPPPRGSVLKKPVPAIPPTAIVPKRLSPSHSIEAPPEKKLKTIEPTEKPGSIKLIPAKPKPILLESDMFMDALNASATNKKEPKKRKRRTSGSKDGNPTSDASPPNTPTTSATSPNRETKSTPFRFYKDTLEIEEEKEKDKSLEKENEVIEKLDTASPLLEAAENEEKCEEVEPHFRTGLNGLRGVLCYHKKKGPKKSIRWRPDTELEQILYFELDETERVNVSKTFTDMKHLERVHEREVFQKARNLINDDHMEARTAWRPLIPVDVGGAIVVDYGKNSKEKEIQATRQKSVLQSLFLKSMIPDSPSDPDVETHPHNEPTVIPLDDITGNQDTVSDFRNTPWPDPKGGATSNNIVPSNINMPPMFSPMPPFAGPFPNAQFSMPGFQGSGSGMVPPGGEWQANMPPNVMVPGGMPPGSMVPGSGPMPVLMNPVNMPPGLMMPPDHSMMGPDMFGGPGPMFPPTMPPDGFNMMDNMNGPQNMFPPGFPVNMPGGPPGPDGGGPFPYGIRGGGRGRGSSNQWRGNWDGPRGRGSHVQGGWKNAKCIHFMKKGSCRSGDSCPYMHPGVNCPY